MAMGDGFDNLMFASMAMPHVAQGNPLAQMQRMRAIRMMAGMGNMRIGPSAPRTQGMGYNPENPMASDPQMFQSPQFQQQANAALGQYGLSLPQNVGPNAFLPNSGFFGNHPRLAGAVESGLYGLANTDTSGGTTMEQIQSGIRGAMAGHAARNAALMNPYMAPFAMAQQMEQLRDLNDQHQLRGAQTRLATANADYAEQKPELAQAKIDEDLRKAQIRALQAQEKREQDENKIPTAMRAHAYARGYDPFNLNPKQQQQVAQDYIKEQRSLRTIAPNISSGGQDARQQRQQIFQSGKEYLDKTLPQYDPGSKEGKAMIGALVTSGKYDYASAAKYLQGKHDEILNHYSRWRTDSADKDKPQEFGDYYQSKTGSNPMSQGDQTGNMIKQMLQQMQMQDMQQQVKPQHLMPNSGPMPVENTDLNNPYGLSSTQVNNIDTLIGRRPR